MANHKSSIKRNRSNEKKHQRNRYQAVTARNAMKKIRTASDKKEAQNMLPKIFSLLDRLAKKSIIHKNKASNLKSELAVHVNKMK